ncbi:hypothetical protein BDN70DRAFT_394291 [Pholiota conissans]|uniref:Uncharacterized protein n=1 Tax=Pholiota conissans TaxID=109636 RepID=A0A9P5Z902_9AGAR|nr:hypothetical protein BDN70DRAFT_394291 [Pholiota conissans]
MRKSHLITHRSRVLFTRGARPLLNFRSLCTSFYITSRGKKKKNQGKSDTARLVFSLLGGSLHKNFVGNLTSVRLRRRPAAICTCLSRSTPGPLMSLLINLMCAITLSLHAADFDFLILSFNASWILYLFLSIVKLGFSLISSHILQ